MSDANLTPRQQKWFASVRAGLERDTGRTLAEWAVIAKGCPETGQRARVEWLKDNHGLMQNRAMVVLGESSGGGWSDPDALIEALWGDPASRAIFGAVDARASAFPEVIRSARKGFTAWSREYQFAALRPMKGGMAMLGLAVAPDAALGLEGPRYESWSERLEARRPLASPAEVDDQLSALLKAAWEKA